MNTTVAFLAQTLAIFMGFFTRVVFTRTLSEGYVGINGLFTDILNILSLSELGVGTAITYALYAPIARRDIKKQQILMRMFRNFYRITAGFVLLAGLCLIPFLDILMKDRPDVNHLIIIYLLYLLNSVVSYLLIYKKTLVDAHQMNYITVMYHNGFLVLQDILQIMVLFLTRNFILFLVIAVVCTIIGNICMSRKADRLFPYLKEPCKEQLPQEERHDILRNVKAMLMHKIGNVVVNNTDNLLISSFVGIISAGIYSNYYLIIGSVRQVLEQAMLGVAASVGNLGVTEENEKIGRIFDSLFFIGYWLFGFAGVCLLELLNPFVKLAFGKKYLFPKDPKEYTSLIGYLLIFAAFFDGKMEYMQHKKSLWAVRKVLKKYGSNPMGRKAFTELADRRKKLQITQKLWKIMIRTFSLGMKWRWYLLMSVGIKILVSCRVDERLSDTGIRKK